MAKIKIEAVIGSPVEKVWTYWTQPEHITKWNFASPDWQCPWAKNDLKVGGKYTARMEAKDGSFGFEFSATYDEVIQFEKISYTMDDGRQAITEFEAADKKTKVTTFFDPDSQYPHEFQQQGWQAILNNFKVYTESN